MAQKNKNIVNLISDFNKKDDKYNIYNYKNGAAGKRLVEMAHHEIWNHPLVEVHADVRSETSERVALVLADSAHERPNAVVVVQMFLSSRRARAHGTANRTLPTVSWLTLVMMCPIDDHLRKNVLG